MRRFVICSNNDKLIYKKDGSITVFLSLILLLILSVTMTTIEVARVNAAQVFTNRAFITAMDSVLAEYYLPLFEDYHIFGLDGGYGSDFINYNTIESKVNSYMNYTFEPITNLNSNLSMIDRFQLYNINITDIKLDSAHTLMEGQGDYYVEQAVSYMKYKEVGDGLEQLLRNLSLIKETEASGTILIYKQNTEEKLFEIDEKILSLMHFIDGIGMDSIGFDVSGNGNITIRKGFVKKICNVTPTKENLGLNNEIIFTSLKDNYINPITTLDAIMSKINLLQNNLLDKDKSRITHLYLTLVDQSNMTKDEVNEHQKAIVEAKEQMDYFSNIESSLIQNINKDMESIITISENTLAAINSSLVIIDELLGMQQEVTKYIAEYEDLLYKLKEQINNELYDSLLEDLQYMSKYKIDANSSGFYNSYDFEKMKDTLILDKEILLNVIKNNNNKISSSHELWEEFIVDINNMKTNMQSYSHSYLYFDYSSYTNQSENKSFIHSVNQLLDNGIMGMLPFEKEEFSQNVIMGNDLPTYLHGNSNDMDLYDLANVLKNSSLNNSNNSILDILHNFSKNISGIETFSDGSEIAKLLLFQEYLTNHFVNYKKNNSKSEIQNMNYELEYILMGYNTDYDNLKGLVTKIVFFRTIMNLISLMSNNSKNGEARSLALSFVGFTGLPSLISITKTMILLIWAFVESLIDVTAMLNGMKIPFYKSGSSIQINLDELFSMNKSYIKNKADKIKENTFLYGLTYQDYIKIFLYLEKQENKVFRSLDLIQINLQTKYEEPFLIKNCIYGVGMSTTMQLKKQFVTSPFVKEILSPHSKDEDYIFKLSYEYSYQ